MNPSWLWSMLGVAFGLAHAAALWRAAHCRQPSLTSFMRMPLVVSLLVGSAVAGSLLAAFGGWASGLAGAAAWLAVRSER
jgi:hypothetical protein